jgi:leucyl aminopeptidase (aminopeptidase T)
MSEPITLSVSLSATGLCVHLPSGRTLSISADEAGARFLKQMLQDAEAHRRYGVEQRGHINGFPTQEIARIWERQERNRLRLAEQAQAMLAEDAQRKAEARERSAAAKRKQSDRVWAKRGIDVSKIKVQL